jgi:hypothetical protein
MSSGREFFADTLIDHAANILPTPPPPPPELSSQDPELVTKLPQWSGKVGAVALSHSTSAVLRHDRTDLLRQYGLQLILRRHGMNLTANGRPDCQAG